MALSIEGITKKKGHLIDKLLEEAFHGSMPNLYDAIRYHMESGGKRLRPLLAIMTYEALGGRDGKILPFAAACEMLHNWILIHDDIEDGDRVRRNKPAVWVKYGLAHGVNVGDLMAQKVFELILKSKEYGVDNEKIFKLVNAMTNTAIKTAEGQTMDINLRGKDNPAEKEYFEMITGKTAHYMTVPMVGAAILAEREELIPKLIAFGGFIGPAFQITDDILDLTEGKGRGETGRDIKEGKRSILAIHCMAHCKGDERKRLTGILNKNPEETTDGDVKFVKTMFEKYKSIEYARKKSEQLARKAKKVADGAPKELREILYFFADYLVKREK